jgi:Protein of unknown function (DUF1173)
MPRYLILGHSVDGTEDDFDVLLKSAHETKERPMCLCREPAIAMYIAHIGENYYLKRLPNTGVSHAPECDRYEMPVALSGKSEVLGQAIVEDTAANTAAIKLDFSLTNGKSRVAPQAGAEKATVKANPAKLTLRGLLDYLWDEAELNLLAPGFVGRRYWGHVQRFLKAATVGKTAKKIALENILFVPEVFSLERKEEIAARRRQVFAGAAQAKHKMIMIGSVKSLEPSRFGGKLLILHAPDFPLYMNEDMFNKTKKKFKNALELWEGHEKSHLVVIATFSVTDTGLGRAEELAFMNVTADWVPFNNILEFELLDHLAREKRRFIKTMRYNMAGDVPLAFGLLLDVPPDGVALFICPGEVAEAEMTAYEELQRETPMPTWFWQTHETMPPLPSLVTKAS